MAVLTANEHNCQLESKLDFKTTNETFSHKMICSASSPPSVVSMAGKQFEFQTLKFETADFTGHEED